MPKAFSLFPSVLIALGVAASHCPRARGELSPKWKPFPACPALLASATTNHISMSQFDPSCDTNSLRPGDSATFLGTLVLQSNRTQWLLYVEAAATNPHEKPAEKPAPLVVNIFGTPISFASKPVPAKLRMLGPFSAAGASKSLKSEDKKTQFSLNESFLGVGLDQAAAVIARRIKATNSVNTASSKNSLAATNVVNGTNSHAKTKLTPAEKRAISGAVPALTSYFEIVQHTEGLEDLLMKLVKTPSLWSIVRHGGVKVGFYFGKEAYEADPADWDLPASVPVYYLPTDLRINGDVALRVTLVVTAPHPPLLICGGVIGLLAERPGDNGTYMTLRVISARRGLEEENKSQNELNEPIKNK